VSFFSRTDYSWDARKDERIEHLTDSRGTALTEGAQVAVNVSGMTGRGEIVSIPHDTRPGKRRIKVKLLFPVAGQAAGHVSTIRNEKNLLVLLGCES
jgi:hypothetical protein